jgi:hypothetical protein
MVVEVTHSGFHGTPFQLSNYIISFETNNEKSRGIDGDHEDL